MFLLNLYIMGKLGGSFVGVVGVKRVVGRTLGRWV